MNDIALRLQKALKANPMTYRALEEKTGISASVLQRYVTGETKKIPLDRIKKIANALGVSAASIMGWDEESTPVTVSLTTHTKPEDLPVPPGTVHRVTVTHVPPAEPAPPAESARSLDDIIAQLEALKAAQADPRYNLTQREKNLVDAFRELPKRMQDKALRIIAALGDQVEGV